MKGKEGRRQKEEEKKYREQKTKERKEKGKRKEVNINRRIGSTKGRRKER